MRVLVVGGAGYIGSHMCRMLALAGHEVCVLDDLSTGHRAAVRWGSLVEAPLADTATLRQLLTAQRYDAVMHFAAASVVSDSMKQPLRYYRNNTAEVLGLLETMLECGVSCFVFSSTASVYGEPVRDLIDETHPLDPINVYGRSKLMAERLLADCAAAHSLRSISLRYFNAAGADPSGEIGESHQPETHLIPRLLRQAAGEDLQVRIYGGDYPTDDGTCIRDYIHVNDLCRAHLLALDRVVASSAGAFEAFNLGSGLGYTVKQVVSAVEATTGCRLDVPTVDRRPGDAIRLVADAARARAVLNWSPATSSIEEIVETAWRWHRRPCY